QNGAPKPAAIAVISQPTIFQPAPSEVIASPNRTMAARGHLAATESDFLSSCCLQVGALRSCQPSGSGRSIRVLIAAFAASCVGAGAPVDASIIFLAAWSTVARMLELVHSVLVTTSASTLRPTAITSPIPTIQSWLCRL